MSGHEEHRPPRWADRFLAWYCNPDLLEEIQGDAHELFYERLATVGKAKANYMYVYDTLRFLRWSNIRRTPPELQSGSFGVWRFNLKLAARHANRNKLLFSVKVASLSICFAFGLFITAYLTQELTFDKFHQHYDRIYRVSSHVDFKDHATHYAVSPFLLGNALKEAIPEVERFSRFTFAGTPIYKVDKRQFKDETTLVADSSFLKLFTFEFIKGSFRALDKPNQIVLTSAIANKIFGSDEVLGKNILVGDRIVLEVAAVIRDIPSNSHLRFDALISWNTFDHEDNWGNLNAYTYIMLRPGAAISTVKGKVVATVKQFQDVIARNYDATLQPRLERIDEIHLSALLDEDIALKASSNTMYVLLAVAALFFSAGFINFINLSLAEIAANLRKIAVIKIFGGLAQSNQKLLLADAIFATLVFVPVTLLFFYLTWNLADSYFVIRIDHRVLATPIFIGTTAFAILGFVMASQINAVVLSKAGELVNLLKGRLTRRTSGSGLRSSLATIQLALAITMIALIFLVSDQFQYISQRDNGFEDDNVVAIKLTDANSQQVQIFGEKLSTKSSVIDVGSGSYYPGVVETKYVFGVETTQGMQQMLVPVIVCSKHYFNVLGVEVVEGVGFDALQANEGDHAFMVNEAAKHYFGWATAVGKEIEGPVDGNGNAFREGAVIGVVRDFNFESLHKSIQPVIFMLSGSEWQGQFVFVKGVDHQPGSLLRSVEQAYQSVWPDTAFEWEFLDLKYESLYQKDREVTNIFKGGLIISSLISCLGIFSLSALLANLHMREMGIRKVLGAAPTELFMLHLNSFARFLGIAIVIAGPMIYCVAQSWLSNFAYHVNVSFYHVAVPSLIAAGMLVLLSSYHAWGNTAVNVPQMLKSE